MTKPTRAEAAVILDQVADQLLEAVRMEEDDLEHHRVAPPPETKREWLVRRAIAKSLKLRAVVFRETCSGKKLFEPVDLIAK